MTSEIVWKVAASLDADALTPRDLAGKFFNFSVNKGLYRQFGLPYKYAYIPLSLQPNTVYDDRIRKLARSKGYSFSEVKLPYSLQEPELGECRLSVKFRIFPPNIASLTVRLKLLDRDLGEIPFTSLFEYRSLRSIPQVYDVVTWSLGLIGSVAAEQSGTPVSTRSYFGFYYSNSAAPQEIPGFWAENKKKLVGLLIGTKNYAGMHDEIVAKVTEKCDVLNLKSTSEHLLVNKQGSILLSPSGGSDYAHKHRFEETMDLAETGLVFREFLDNDYPDRRRGQEGFLDYVFRIIQAWVGEPDAVLNISYSNKLLWRLLTDELGLTQKLDLIKSQNPWLKAEIDSASTYFIEFGDRWWESPDFAGSFPARSHLFTLSVVLAREDPGNFALCGRKARVARAFLPCTAKLPC